MCSWEKATSAERMRRRNQGERVSGGDVDRRGSSRTSLRTDVRRCPRGNVFPRCCCACAALRLARRALWFLKSARSFTPRATRSRAIGRGAAGVSLEDILEELIAERTSRFRGLGAAFSRRSARSSEGSSHERTPSGWVARSHRPPQRPSLARSPETELLTSRVPPPLAQAIKLAKDELVKRDRKNKTRVADALDLVNLLAKATNGTLESPAEVLQAIGVAWQAINASNATAARASRADGKGRPSAHASDAPAADLADALLLVQSRWLEEGLPAPSSTRTISPCTPSTSTTRTSRRRYHP